MPYSAQWWLGVLVGAVIGSLIGLALLAGIFKAMGAWSRRQDERRYQAALKRMTSHG